jgi:hypothetical protein
MKLASHGWLMITLLGAVLGCSAQNDVEIPTTFAPKPASRPVGSESGGPQATSLTPGAAGAAASGSTHSRTAP